MTMTSDKTAPAGRPEGGGGADLALSVRDLWKIFGPKADKVMGTPDAQLPRS